MLAPRDLLARRRTHLRQAFRVTLAALLAFVGYRLLDLPQGYWAVFTVVIVMQGSIATTLGAATDRLVGTIAGAVLGGLAAMLFPRDTIGLGLALALIVAPLAYAASMRSRLRVAPITAAILLLSQPPGLTPADFVVDRIVEIALGGFIGVSVSVLVFPVRSRQLVIARAAGVLDRIHDLLMLEADQVERGQPLSFSPDHAALRAAVGAVEQAMTDAARERAAHLADHGIPDAIPRTLWRVRNDLVLTARALDHPLPEPIAREIIPATIALLRAYGDFAAICSRALRSGAAPDRGGVEERHSAFEHAFQGLRGAGLIRPLDFSEASHVFGLAFTLQRLKADLGDLADRIAELSNGNRRRTAEAQ